jgi:hypothetical protein
VALDPYGPSVVAVAQSGQTLAWRPGTGRFPFITLSLAGKQKGNNRERSNSSGIGARIEVHSGSTVIISDYLPLLAGSGQSQQPTSAGLAGNTEADFVRITWPDGVPQTELNLTGALAIFGPGEEIHLNFSAPTEPPPKGWTRPFILKVVGWCKDTDLYTTHGDTVMPLPSLEDQDPSSASLHNRFNTRFQRGATGRPLTLAMPATCG